MMENKNLITVVAVVLILALLVAVFISLISSPPAQAVHPGRGGGT